jgi:hypothetical protein
VSTGDRRCSRSGLLHRHGGRGWQLIGNCVATIVVAAWEGDLDYAQGKEVLDGRELVDVTVG